MPEEKGTISPKLESEQRNDLLERSSLPNKVWPATAAVRRAIALRFDTMLELNYSVRQHTQISDDKTDADLVCDERYQSRQKSV